jgi:hypothetical protein
MIIHGTKFNVGFGINPDSNDGEEFLTGRHSARELFVRGRGMFVLMK